jgi:hypothetical protein
MSETPSALLFTTAERSDRSRSQAGAIDEAASPARRARITGSKWLLLGLLLLAAVLGARGITSEAAVSLYDTPRYLMNGVFLTDFLKSGTPWTIDGVLRYAEVYYARYPALSLGHHPPLISVCLIPVYALFGVSVFWARAVALGFFLLATGAIFSLARRLYTVEIAGWATLLFVTNPFVVTYGQQVLSEMPMLALILVAMVALVRFVESNRTADFAWFVGAAVASVYAKQLAVYVFPVYAGALLLRVNWRRLIRRDIVMLTATGLVLLVPIAIMTGSLSPQNVALVERVATNGRGLSKWQFVLSSIFGTHLKPIVMAIVATGIAGALIRRDWRVVWSIGWIGAVLVSVIVLTGRFESARYAFAAMPAYCLGAAGLLAAARSRREKLVAIGVLCVAVACQVWYVRSIRPTGADGYEAAARYVTSHSPSPTVLFSGPVDVGYFVFFVRKQDPTGKMMVLRSDKILATSRTRPIEQEEISPLLRRYGTRYIVIEDRRAGRVLEWLREQLKTDRFAERLRVRIGTRDPRLTGVDLVVYEFLDATPPALDTVLDLKLPLVRRSIDVRLGDVLGR